MYNFFNNARSGEMGKLHFPEFNYIYRNMKQNADKVVKYYRSYPGQVWSDNFLVILLQSLTVGYGMEPKEFVDKVSDATMQLSRVLKMTSAINAGKLYQRGAFLRPNSNEVLVAVDTKFDLTNIETTWKDLQPVRYLHHEYTDITFPLLYGKQSRYNVPVPDLDFAVIEVNVPMLAVQYHMWRKSTAWQAAGEHQSIGQFVKSYPVVNAIHSFTDYAIFNRLKALTYNVKIPKSINTHPFPVLNMEAKLDRALGNVLEGLLGKKLNFKNVLQSVPLLSVEDAWDLLHIPKVPPTRQIEWALDLCRLPAIAWLLTIREGSESATDGQILNSMKISLRAIKSDNTFRVSLGPTEALHLNTYIDKFIKPFI
jgi:hypothetical protein